MVLKIDKWNIENNYLSRIKNSSNNKWFTFESIYSEKDATINFDGDNGSYLSVIFYKNETDIILPDESSILLLTDEAFSDYSDYDLLDDIPYLLSVNELSEDVYWDTLYEITMMFVGAYRVSKVKRDICKEAIYKGKKYFSIFHYDVYIDCCNSVKHSKNIHNMTFHVNCEHIKNITNNCIKKLNKKYGVWDFKEYYRICAEENSLLVYPKYSFYFIKNRTTKGNKLSCLNGINGDFYYYNECEYLVLFCRNIEFIFLFNKKAELLINKKTNRIIYDGFADDNLSREIYVLIWQISSILTGAGDISYEKRIDEYGNVIGHNIYVEKEYETSYTKEYGDITFYINDGYKHKTELERFEDFWESEDNKSATINDIPRMVMKALQTTKASRYLCYKLIDNAECVTLYFNGTSGDFYIKVSQEELMLHCRNMSICFTEKAEGLVEEDDEIIKYSARTKEIKELLLASYEMIYILAGAGEVKSSSVYSEEEKSYSYEIELEKEYEKDHERSVGNVSFIIKKEEIVNEI